MANVSKKEANRFKFIPFSERIAGINVDVFHRVAHRNEESTEGAKTNVKEAADKWIVLNRTKEWLEFHRAVASGGIITLPQILNQKERICELFCQHLPLQTEHSLQPVLELLVAFVKDLRHEFYPFYPVVLKELIKLLKSRNPDVIEQTFVCLAYLFKYLVRHLVKDLDTVLIDLAPLLDESQPEYIREFAAESFAFVARRVKDKLKFLTLVLATSQNHPQLVAGCGRLVFETMCGIKGQVHSSAPEMLKTIFCGFGAADLPQNLLLVVTQHVSKAYLNRIDPKHSLIFSVIVGVLEGLKEDENSLDKILKPIFTVMLEILDYRGGIHLRDSKSVADTLLKICLMDNLSLDVRSMISELVVKLLTAANVKLPQESAARLGSMMLKQPKGILLNFVENACEYSGFEAVILPSLLEMSSVADAEIMETLAKIIVKKTSPTTDWSRYPLKFRSSIVQESLLEKLYDPKSSLTELSSCVLILPHVEPIDGLKASNALVTVTGKLLEFVETDKNTALCSLYVALEGLNFFQDKSANIEKIYENVLPLAGESFIVLKILEILTVIAGNRGESLDFVGLRGIAVERLSSPFHHVRTTALKILSNICGDPLVATCLNAEMTPLTVQTYRNATLHVRELFFGNLPPDTNVEIPFRFLLGYLFSNFSLVEADIIQAIQSYDSCQSPVLWEIFKQQLNKEADSYGADVAGSFDVGCGDRVDFNLFKDRLWKVLQNFVLNDDQERDIVDMAINYSQSHAVKQYWEYTCDMRHRDVVNEEKVVEGAEENFRINKKMLCYQLDVISKSRKKYRQLEMRKLCVDLLLDNDTILRKSALACLIAQNSKNLSQYRKHLMDLINEDGFKTAMVTFHLDKETGQVKEGHRDVVMPIVLRLLYSKMVSSAPTQRGNKSSAAASRRKQVMRFLSACQQSEIREFFRMAFAVLKFDFEEIGSFSGLMERMGNLSFDRVVHPRKLQSCINLANVVLEYLGGHLTVDLQRFLLMVIVAISATVSGLLANREKILSGFIPMLKKLRGVCMTTLIAFFDKFAKYPWNEDEISAVFSVAVWPTAEKLAVEGIHSPTPLLKLFTVWSQHPRYFVLFARYCGDDETKTALSFMLDLLLADHCQQAVVNAIMSILERLLTLGNDVPMETDEEPLTPDLELHNLRNIDEEVIKKLNLKEELNYGSKILIPHVGVILEMLRRQLARGEKRTLNKTETTVLARITELATSPEHGDALIGLLLRILAGKTPSDDDVLINTVLTVKNLLTIVSKPLTYLRNLAIIFGNVELVQARKELVECMAHLAARCPELEELATIVRELNAFDRRWIDQCDFNRRLDALKRVRIMAADGKLGVDLALFVIHTGFFFLTTEKDLSIRDSTELCLKEISPKILESVEDNICHREYLTETLLKRIHAGILGKDERLKNSVISLLGHLARECSKHHHVLRDLSLFANRADSEVDFFENVNHLQLYRRNRALLKLVSIVKGLTAPIGVRTITQFLMPLSNQFLCCETYANKNSLVDAAIECVGILCRLLPWYQYQSVLKFYLLKLRTVVEYQRQCVRLVIAILDAFHFDLSQADQNEQPEDVIENSELKDTEDVEEKEDDEEFTNTEMETDEGKILVDVVVKLSAKAALRVQKTISTQLLAQLYKAIGERTAVEAAHRVNKKSQGPDKDEEDILRVPIAVTLVKLLQKLPGNILDRQLPGILTKLCTFLKSHLESVRRITRETLQQIMVAVGPNRLPLLLGEMTALLTKGFHVHVLAFTINSVVQSLQTFFQPGDFDINIPVILRVCSADLFGAVAEEKEVTRIKVKHTEVRSHKSYNLLNLAAQLVSEKCLTDLILPVKQALSTKNSHKTMTKCRECLRQIVLGLAANKFIPVESLIVFLYGTASESIPELLPAAPAPPKKFNPKERQDCFLLPPQPKSRASSAPVKSSSRSGAHVIVEFGLQLLMVLLKQDSVKKGDLEGHLDPFVPILRAAVDSQHVKVTTLAIKCLTRLTKYDLPSLKENMKPISVALFRLLHKFAVAGLSKGDNFDLVLAAFKMVSVIVRDVSYFKISEDQLHALLLYAEQDIHDNSRQAVAFGLIKSVLHRKINTPELHPVMEKIAALSVTSDLEHVRVQARQTALQYIMDYPLGKKLENLIGFFIAQLDYDVESGRQSALEMIFSMINAFPVKTLQEQSGLFFLSLGTRLFNDDSPDCKKMVSAVIKGMLTKLDDSGRDELYDMILIWLKQKKLLHRRLAVQLAGIFVTLEKANFERRLAKTVPLILRQLTGDRKPGQFVKAKAPTEGEECLTDHHLYLVLVFLVKMCVHCPALLTSNDNREQISILADTAQCLLCHDHEWVRVGAVQFLGAIFSAIDPQTVADAINGRPVDLRFWDAAEIAAKLRSLILDHTAQFVPGVEITQDFTEQLTKNLVFFAKVLRGVKGLDPTGNDEEIDEGKGSQQLPSFPWFVRRMRRIVNLEVAKTPAVHNLRSAVFMWIGAVTVCLSKDDLLPVLYNLAAPLVREMEIAQGETTVTPIARLATEVAGKLKKKVGIDAFAECSVKLQSQLLKKRADRKSTQAQEFVVDPESAVKKKMMKQTRKKENRKRQKEILHGKVAGKFRPKKRKLDG